MPKSVKDRILAERGLVKASRHNPKHNTFSRFVYAPSFPSSSKTPMMKYLESKYHIAIEQVLVSGSLSVIAKALGNEVDVTTISRWIKRFHLRYSATNLPNCSACNHSTTVCQGGVCAILMSLELYGLVLLKRSQMLEKELLNEGNQDSPATAPTVSQQPIRKD